MRIAVCDDCPEDARTLQRLLAGHERSVYFDADSLLADAEGRKDGCTGMPAGRRGLLTPCSLFAQN